MSYQQDKYDLGRTIGRRYIEPLKGESIDEPDSHNKRRVISRNSSNEDKSSKKSSWSEDSGHSTSTVHLTHANMPHNSNASKMNDAKSFNWREMPSDAVLKIERPHFRLPHKSSLLKKLSDSSYVVQSSPDEPQHPHTIQYTGEELRSQLPWSYFGARSDVIKPKKSFIELRDDEDLPPVPVPDYTMKFAQKDRPINSNKERRSTPAKKFINPKKGTTQELDRSRKLHKIIVKLKSNICSNAVYHLRFFLDWDGPEYRY